MLVDTGDRMPSPPGIFVVWDEPGLVVKRIQVLPHSEPPQVKITVDNAKSTIPTSARSRRPYIQGRVIGQWRWPLTPPGGGQEPPLRASSGHD